VEEDEFEDELPQNSSGNAAPEGEGVAFEDSRRKSIQLCRLPFNRAEGFLPPNRPTPAG
jgi:hypothetical protein